MSKFDILQVCLTGGFSGSASVWTNGISNGITPDTTNIGRDTGVLFDLPHGFDNELVLKYQYF